MGKRKRRESERKLKLIQKKFKPIDSRKGKLCSRVDNEEACCVVIVGGRKIVGGPKKQIKSIKN